MNDNYKKLLAILSALMEEHDWTGYIMDVLRKNGTPYAKSRVQGWRFSRGHKNYREMTSDEFLDVLDAIINWLNDR